MRHRQAAPRTGRGQHPRRGHAPVPQPLGAHRQGDAEERPRQGRPARPLEHPRRAADRARSALRPLRQDVRGVAEGRHRSAALLHRRLQQHVHLEAGLRLHLRVPPPERGRLHRAGARTSSAVPQLRRERAPSRPTSHAADRQRATRFRGSARRGLPSRRIGRDRPLPPGDHRAHRPTAAKPRASPTTTCCERS